MRAPPHAASRLRRTSPRTSVSLHRKRRRERNRLFGFRLRLRLRLRASERDVAVLARRVLLALAGQDAQGADDGGAGVARAQHLVDVAERRRLVRVGEALLVVGDEARAGALALRGVRDACELAAEDDVDRALR